MRVLLAGMTNLLVQIVAGVISQSPESEVVQSPQGGVAGEGGDIGSVADQVRSSGADVVMMPASDRPDAEAVWPLLYQFPRLKVVTLSRSGEGGFVHELHPFVRVLHEMSASALNAALRRNGAGAAH